MTKRFLAVWLACLAAAATGLVASFAAGGLGVAALYVTAFGATLVICGLEILRRTPS